MEEQKQRKGAENQAETLHTQTFTTSSANQCLENNVCRNSEHYLFRKTEMPQFYFYFFYKPWICNIFGQTSKRRDNLLQTRRVSFPTAELLVGS